MIENITSNFGKYNTVAGTTMVTCYLAKVQLPSDESHSTKNRDKGYLLVV